MSSSSDISQNIKIFTRRAPCLILLCLLLLPFTISNTSLAATNRSVEKQRIKKGIQKYRINIRKLQDGIAGQQLQVETSREQKRDLLAELAQIDQKLYKLLDKLHGLESRMEKQQQLIDAKNAELHLAMELKQNVQTHLQKRIKAFYKMGEIGVANVAFSSESMPSMLRFRDSFASLIDYDKELLNTYRLSITDLQHAETTLELEKGILDDFIILAKEDQAAIGSSREDKERLINQIETQKELHEQAVREMQKAAEQLAQSLDVLRRENDLFDQGFLLDKGKHPAPLHGQITALFGEKRKNKLGITGNSTGITIATHGTQQVKAIYEGQVRYAAYLYGYGNTVIIDHGFQYFSILSRLEKLLVREGDLVTEAQPIALTGDTATLMEDGIYLEIRLGSKPLDPLQWLDKQGLILP